MERFAEIPPDIGRYFSPREYALNDQHFRRLNDVGAKPKVLLPEDPSYPSDSRSSCTALTPKYRGGQNKIFAITDYSPYHGDGIESLTRGGGTFYSWDGVTTYYGFVDSTLTPAQKLTYRQGLFDFVFPNGSTNRVMRGLQDLYNTVNPFADPFAPTVDEIESWNVEVIKHFRKLLGLNQTFTNDQKLFIASKWSSERQSTNIWNKYPSTGVNNYGPCPNGTSHCGAWFSPSQPSDQLPYWNDYICAYPTNITKTLLGYYNSPYTPQSYLSYTEGILVGRPGTWMTLMSEMIWDMIKDGVYEGHHEPFFVNRSWGYHVMDASASGNSWRIKWSFDSNSVPPGYEI